MQKITRTATSLAIANLGLAAAALIGAVACSGTDTPATIGSGGSAASSGGNASGGSSSGASLATGGSHASGGNVASGGTIAAGIGGASAPTGGAMPTGGTTAAATGGASSVNTTGGAKPTGGTTSTSTGGATSTSTGGTKPAGGATSSSTGGTSTAPTGGTSSTSTGGTKATGGTSTTGGTKATGGSGGTGTAPITIWMAGDSTMMNCSSACPCGWGSQFDPYFNANVTVSNQAVGGRSIQTWLYESNVSSTLGANGECTLTSTTYNARWTNMLASMKAGDYLFIAFGINDGDSACPRHVGSARYVELLGVMAQAAKAKGVSPIFLTPTDAIACSGSTVTQNRGFLTETKSAGTTNSVTVIDLNALSMALYKQLALCPNAADYTSTTSAVGKFFCDDHTHFESAGAKQIAGVVANAIKTQVPALAPYLL